MYSVKTVFSINLLCLFSVMTFAQRGSLGDRTVSIQNEIVNTYTTLTNNASVGATSITVASNTMGGAVFSTNLNTGDLILIVQQQGALLEIETISIDWGGHWTLPYDPLLWGQVLNYNNAGNFEYAEVASISGGGTINLNCPLTKNYTASGHVQVVRIPRFNNLTIQNNSSITCPLWNGATGGVVAIEVDGNLTLNGTGMIEANSKGFRGGQTINISSFNPDPSVDGWNGSYEAYEGSEKGEGIGGYHAEYDALYSRYCKGAPGNGGGGANFHNAGGGGGSNVGVGTYYSYGVADPGPANAYAPAWNLENPNLLTQPSGGGGRGGYSHATANLNPLTNAPNNTNWSGDARRYTYGLGGRPLLYDPQRIFMGGGGGAGDENDGDGGNGGRGGGLVLLTVYGTISGSGMISANGENGFNATGPPPAAFSSQKSGDDGAGGAGGGGAIHIANANPIPGTVNLSAVGGNGGNQVLLLGNFAANTMDGPGGGGAGGMIAFTSGTPIQNVSGGLGGTSSSTIANNFPYNGATGGAQGMSGLSTTTYDLTIDDVAICGGGATTLTVTVEGILPSGGDVEWFTSQFGGTSFHTGLSYNTPVLAANTTYWVGVCPGTFRVPVNVLVSPSIDITGAATITDETCAGNDGGVTGLTASGGFGTLAFDWNGNASLTEDLVNASAGNYTLTVTDDNGCTATSGPYTINPSTAIIFDVSGMTIVNETCGGNDGSITGIIATGSGLTYEWNGNPSVDADLNGAAAGDYTLTVTDSDMCTASVGPFAIGAPTLPVIDLTGMTIEDETCFGNDGSITGIVVSGSGLTYEWNGNSSVDADLTGMATGDYTLTVTDSDMCSNSAGPFTIGETTLPVIDISGIVIDNETCLGNDGSITGISVIGTGLTYEWNSVASASEDLTGISSGDYTLTVTDENGCIVSEGPISVGENPGPSIDETNMVVQGEVCNQSDGSITGIIATGNNLSFTWNGVNSADEDLSNTTAGSYTLIVTDDLGCTVESGPHTIPLIGGSEIDATALVVSPVSCEGVGGSIQGIVATGDGVVFEWNGNASSSEDIAGLTAGDYTLEVTDVNGCSVNYGPVTVGENVSPLISISPDYSEIESGENVTLTLTVTSSSDVDVINWVPSTGLSCDDCVDPIASPTETTTYTVVVTNEDGCTTSETATVVVNNPCGELFIPDIFSPNSDGLNDELCVLGGCIMSIDFSIFNRWGEMVFHTESPDGCWDAMFRGEMVNSGVYVYKATGIRSDGTSFELSGNLTVVR